METNGLFCDSRLYSIAEVARRMDGVDPETARKWLRRWRCPLIVGPNRKHWVSGYHIRLAAESMAEAEPFEEPDQ